MFLKIVIFRSILVKFFSLNFIIFVEVLNWLELKITLTLTITVFKKQVGNFIICLKITT